MDFTGRVIIDLPMEEGVSRAGNAWRKKCWILETFGPYPKKVKIDVFGRNVDTVHLEMGKVYNVSVDAESREFNGKWYTDISCYAAREAEVGPGGYPQPAAAPAQQPAQAAPTSSPFPPVNTNPFPAANDPFATAPGAPGSTAFEDSSDDLPF